MKKIAYDCLAYLGKAIQSGKKVTQKVVPIFEIQNGKWHVNKNGLRIILVE